MSNVFRHHPTYKNNKKNIVGKDIFFENFKSKITQIMCPSLIFKSLNKSKKNFKKLSEKTTSGKNLFGFLLNIIRDPDNAMFQINFLFNKL